MQKKYRDLPEPLNALNDLANDIRWTWSHAGDKLWRSIDADIWHSIRNPYVILQTTPSSRFEKLAQDQTFLGLLRDMVTERENYLNRKGWYQQHNADSSLQRVAYFCMEYGLGEALPLYAGGLGILSGDYLKASSDLGVPLVAVGLLFDQGYFRQILDNTGWQQELYPSCDTSNLPISPLLSASGEWLQVSVALPGRSLLLRLWQVQIGNVNLYLLDSKHPQNSLADQGICNQLYPEQMETRLLQQLVLGIGGWRALQTIPISVDVCHLNEAHCAFVVLERASTYMLDHKVSFDEAITSVRAGTIFTMHTPVPAANDRFPVEIVKKYLSVYAKFMDLPVQRLIDMGVVNNEQDGYIFSPLKLAIDNSISVNAVSESHCQVTRKILQAFYPRWPVSEVPVSYITNGIHVPGWDSAWADRLWTDAAGKERWMGDLSHLQPAIDQQSDERLWTFKCMERSDLISYVRKRYSAALVQQGAAQEEVLLADNVLDPNALTLGLARRFTEYKRPNLLLNDKQRFINLLVHSTRPVQIIIAGKAHPQDLEGKAFIQEWVALAKQSKLRNHIVFLSDYDITLAQELVQGVDVWINTPRFPWEACGTSGMKVLANGGLNISVLDGWWAQAYRPQYGWAIGDRQVHGEKQWDDVEAQQLYQCLEQEVIPEFYHRDSSGIPRKWLAKIRSSMATLAPYYSSNRMVREYVEELYISSADRFHERTSHEDSIVSTLLKWKNTLCNHWLEIHWGDKYLINNSDGFEVELQVYLGGVPPDDIRVELYAESMNDGPAQVILMQRKTAILAAVGGFVYQATVKTSRPEWHFTPRIIAWHEKAVTPCECNKILWWSE